MQLYKFHGYVTVGNVSPAKTQETNKKNEHYHWIVCRHSIQIYYVNWIVMFVDNCVG